MTKQLNYRKEKMQEEDITFGDNALNTDHGTDKLGEELSWSNSSRNKRAIKPNKYLFSFLQVLGINTPSDLRHSIRKRLHILAGVSQQPASHQTLKQKP